MSLNRATNFIHYAINFELLAQIARSQANCMNPKTDVHIGYICKMDSVPFFLNIQQAYKVAERGEIFSLVVHVKDSDFPDVIEVRNEDLFIRTPTDVSMFKPRPVTSAKDYLARKNPTS